MSVTAANLRRISGIVLLAAAGPLALSVDVVGGRRFRLMDGQGAPVAGAFVSARYSAGTRSIWPLAYEQGAFVVRTDRDGSVRFPRKVLLRFPFIHWASPARLYVAAYAPRLHAACMLADPEPQDSWCARLGAGGDEPTFRIADLGGDPVRRFWSLWLLLQGFVSPGTGDPVVERELGGAVRAEYDRFLTEFGEARFANAPGEWGHIDIADWTREPDVNRTWRFFLREVPFHGSTLEEKVSRLEAGR